MTVMYQIILKKVLHFILVQSSSAIGLVFPISPLFNTEMGPVRRRDLFASAAPCSIFIPFAPHLHCVSIFTACLFFHIFIHKQ